MENKIFNAGGKERILYKVSEFLMSIWNFVPEMNNIRSAWLISIYKDHSEGKRLQWLNCGGCGGREK